MSKVFQPDIVLRQQAELLLDASIEPSTKATYKAGFECFIRFLILSRLSINVLGDTLPSINENILVFFVTHCQNQLKLRYDTIKTYLAGVKFFYMKKGQSIKFKDYEQLHHVLRGVKKLQTPNSMKRLPITFSVLYRLCHCLDQGVFHPFLDLMMKCVCSMAFYGFLRCGEFTSRYGHDYIMFQDINFAEDLSYYTLNLKSSKTDPFHQGVKIKIFENAMLNPVRTMKCYHEKRINMCQLYNHNALFIDDQGTPLSRCFFLSHLKETLLRLGLDDKRYSGHSFRIGAASTAAAAGVPDHMIQSLGRWSSDCYTRYIRIDTKSIKAAQVQMCRF